MFNLSESLKLQRNINKYELLKDTNADEEDKLHFVHTKRSLEILGFMNDEILSIFKIVAVVLKLGNLNFIPITNIDGTEGCEISNDYGEFLLDFIEKQLNFILFHRNSRYCTVVGYRRTNFIKLFDKVRLELATNRKRVRVGCDKRQSHQQSSVPDALWAAFHFCCESNQRIA